MERCGWGQRFLFRGALCVVLIMGVLFGPVYSNESTSDAGTVPAAVKNLRIVDITPPPPLACDIGAPNTSGSTFYIDPEVGRMSNDGTKNRPWRTLQEVIENGMIETREYADPPYNGSNAMVVKNEGAPVKAGDTLILMGGHHGEFNIRRAYNEYPITIKAAAGETPILSRIYLAAASKWIFKGLSVTSSAAPAKGAGRLVRVQNVSEGPSRHVVIDNCKIYSVEDVSTWTQEQWNTLSWSGIQVSGECITIRNNHCLNVNFGITIQSNNSLVSGNTVENFSGDGLRGLANDLVFENNLVKNCYAVNQNHDDGFQSWSINDDPPRERVVLRGNTFINYEDPNQPFRGTLQGIGCFDGPYVDWVVENNLVVTDHWHGISLYGAQNCRIINNTVVDLNATRPGPPWILVSPHKDGSPSRGCVIRNNIAAKVTPSNDTVADHNYLLKDGDNIFKAPHRFDYRLVWAADSPVIDKGSMDLAPKIDMDGNSRPRGDGVDLGCYEY